MTTTEVRTSPFAAALRQARELLAAAAVTEPDEAAVATKVRREIDEALVRLSGQEGDRDLIAIVCHDLKEPLASIVMGAGFLRRTIPQDEAAALRVVDAVARSANRMAQVVGDFHDLARLETCSLKVDALPCDLVSVVFGAVAALNAQANEKGVALDLEAPSPVRARCDRARVGQVVTKLLDNAIKFTAPGGRVVVRGAMDATGARLIVEDTGCGIPPDRLASVFDHRANARRASREGPGLGLAIVKGLVDLQGGTVTIESRAGEGPMEGGKAGTGTTVTVTLPAA